MKALLTFLVTLILFVTGNAASVQIGAIKADVVTDPATVPIGKANLVITLRDAQGKPVEGAAVTAIARMPGMNMGEREQPGRASGEPGTYLAPAVFPMVGAYEVKLTVNGETGIVSLRTGQQTTAPSTFPFGTVVWGIGALVLVAYTWSRMKRTGQTFELASVINLRSVGSLLLLGAAFAVVLYAINNWRRPGSMTPIESQAMEMNTPPPDGVMPVELATAEAKAFAEEVTYSGQAVAYAQQDIVSRVTGAILYMPSYVGDPVTAGQVLVRLDTTQLDPEVAMRNAQVDRAAKGVEVADLEHRMAQDEVRQAAEELGMAQGELAEAEAMLRATEEERGSAVAMLRETQAELASMEAEKKVAVADRKYMQAENERVQVLFSKGAATRNESQLAASEAEKAAAMVQQVEARIAGAQAGVARAQSMIRKVEAEIAAAKRAVDTARAGTKAKAAMQQVASTRSSATKVKISQERAMVNEAKAGLKAASAQRRYAELTSLFGGVVTERLLSPGQVVMPGQTMLRVAQVSPIRLQANVPQAVLSRISVGNAVRVSAGTSETFTIRVSSVSPSVDPAVRMGTVEALLPNRAGVFRPGQFVRMRIVLGEPTTQTIVPWRALVNRPTSSPSSPSEQSWVWMAKPALNGEFEAKMVEVRVLGRTGAEAAVTGIPAGSKVVVAPPTGLRDGMRVMPSQADSPLTGNPTVLVTEQGYEPAILTVPANKAITITFIRKADPSCGDTLFFPTLDIKKTLPVNEPVTVELPPMKPGETGFACSMNMYKGTVVAR